MNKTEECINALQEHIAGMAEHAYYSVYEGQDGDETFQDFMEVLMNRIEHVTCEYLIVHVLGKNPAYLESMTSQPVASDVQKLIKQLKEKE
ncbi:MAG: hypothetical protein C0490_09785 [Marivirga sp.]|nr:hypothetical protein [Marivirga sp.]